LGWPFEYPFFFFFLEGFLVDFSPRKNGKLGEELMDICLCGQGCGWWVDECDEVLDGFLSARLYGIRNHSPVLRVSTVHNDKNPQNAFYEGLMTPLLSVSVKAGRG